MNGIKNHDINMKMNTCGLFSLQTIMGIDLLCQFVLMYIFAYFVHVMMPK